MKTILNVFSWQSTPTILDTAKQAGFKTIGMTIRTLDTDLTKSVEFYNQIREKGFEVLLRVVYDTKHTKLKVEQRLDDSLNIYHPDASMIISQVNKRIVDSGIKADYLTIAWGASFEIDSFTWGVTYPGRYNAIASFKRKLFKQCQSELKTVSPLIAAQRGSVWHGYNERVVPRFDGERTVVSADVNQLDKWCANLGFANNRDLLEHTCLKMKAFNKSATKFINEIDFQEVNGLTGDTELYDKALFLATYGIDLQILSWSEDWLKEKTELLQSISEL